jgi:DNA-binding transcriptional ArsR family regulator
VNRLRIIRRLADAPASVTDLIEHVGLSQPLVSWHVGKLRAAGLVETRRNGRETICRLRPESFERFEASERRALGMAPVGGPVGSAGSPVGTPPTGSVKAAS